MDKTTETQGSKKCIDMQSNNGKMELPEFGQFFFYSRFIQILTTHYEVFMQDENYGAAGIMVN